MKQEFDKVVQSSNQTKRTEQTTEPVQQANWNPDRYRTNLNPFYLSPCSVERRADVEKHVDHLIEVEPDTSPLAQIFEQTKTAHISSKHRKAKFTTGIVVGAIIGGSVSIITSVKQMRQKH
ncbi:hypothetical protein [Exiguobacterium sp. s193]|uniref:hypothetical protein n=1 Tax=Exiguobacterium sp. s193 TaxID=2751207 RepID=UPI001BE51795|nr:hypothetical protein [Exiguobacterium sp. s193]